MLLPEDSSLRQEQFENTDEINTKVKILWYEGNGNKNLRILQRCLDLFNKDEINKVLVEYNRTIELIIAEFPALNVEVRKDWAIANARCPEWFGESLSTRVQNSMLVAALLLTVTASSFLTPVNDDQTSVSFRITFYLNGLCSFLFLISIFLGICFIENGMNRAYCWSDRFSLIMTQYAIKDLSQVCAVLGTLMFPITLLLPMQSTYLEEDSYAMYAISAFGGLLLVYFQISSTMAAAAKQKIRTMMLKEITDAVTGRLLPQFQPPADAEDDENPQQMFQLMYSKRDT